MEVSLQQTGSTRWECLIGGASKWKAGQVLEKNLLINNEILLLRARYIEKVADSFLIEFSWDKPIAFAEILQVAGNMPLPPYIKRQVTEQDKERYQTVFGKYEGSVAAPTASLHFTTRTFECLEQKNISLEFLTLHVGAGTFKPVKTETIAAHQMHQEPFSVKKEFLQKLIGSETVIVAGTTSLRTVESLYWFGVKLINNLPLDGWSLQQWETYDLQEEYPGIDYKDSLLAVLRWMENHDQTELHCYTSIIIVPGYQFKIPGALITNFHQPQSTLLLLIAAFIGEDWKKIYQHALDHGYRFLSYGDSSLLWRND
jgi:S-adenosylmethionine:tRNA ribosyltransferase-isomerase